jgi:hypothetical protein
MLGRKGPGDRRNDFRFWRSLGLSLALLLPIASNGADVRGKSSADIASRMLDGKRFAGPIGQKGMESDHDDVLVFENGTF